MSLKLDMNLKLDITPELRQMALRLVLGTMLLCGVVYLAVGMPILEARRLTQEIAQTHQRAERQKLLMPSWALISQFSENATLAALLPPAPQPVPRTSVYTMPEQLSQTARALGVEPLEVNLNPASLAQDPGTIQLTGIFSGQLEGMRGFLSVVAGMPSLSTLDKMELRAVDGHLELFLQLRLALTN